MNINDALEQGSSITEINRVLELFTDRIPERRRFASYLNDPARKSILFFHGDGGNGKAWLLRILQARYCRHLPAKSWDFVKSQATDNDFILHFEGAADFKPVPYAYLDFVDAHNNLGNTLQSLADLQAKLSQHDKAQDNYRQSIDWL